MSGGHSVTPWRCVTAAHSLVGDDGVGGWTNVQGRGVDGCLALKECKASTIFPLGDFGADFAGWDPAPTQAKTGSSDDGNAQPRVDVSARLRV